MVNHVYGMACHLCGRGSSVKAISTISVEDFRKLESGGLLSNASGPVPGHEAAASDSAVDMAECDEDLWAEERGSSVYRVDEPWTFAEVMAAQEPEVIAAALPAAMQQSMWERLKALQCDSEEEDVDEVPVSYD